MLNHASYAHRNGQTVALSACGNYALVGLSNGQMDKYTMQSGRHVAMFAKDAGMGSDYIWEEGGGLEKVREKGRTEDVSPKATISTAPRSGFSGCLGLGFSAASLQHGLE